MKATFIVSLFLFACSTSPIEHTLVAQEQSVQQDSPIAFSNIQHSYLWKDSYDLKNALVNRIATPVGFERVEADSSSFSSWLRHLPLKPENSPVYLYNGSLKSNQNVHFAVVDIDVGVKDLQQCADAVMRLRAEYLLANHSAASISFNFTNGTPCVYSNWVEGARPLINGNDVNFVKTKPYNDSYTEFKNYMQMVYNYCGTYSLSQELKQKTAIEDIIAGDVFIKGGFPGHAVIVTDVAKNSETDEVVFLLAQSYMPAQDIHILKNFNDNSISPWFNINFVSQLNTPEWTFQKSELKEF